LKVDCEQLMKDKEAQERAEKQKDDEGKLDKDQQ